MVEEFNREDFDFVKTLEDGHVDMVPLRYVKKDCVDEKQEGFNVEELAP